MHAMKTSKAKENIPNCFLRKLKLHLMPKINCSYVRFQLKQRLEVVEHGLQCCL